MKEWWEYRGICSGCDKVVTYAEQYHAACSPNDMDTSWQRRVNFSNEQWRPGYRFRTSKTTRGRTYGCYYDVDRNGKVIFAGGVRAANEKAIISEWQERCDALPTGNWYPGCEL